MPTLIEQKTDNVAVATEHSRSQNAPPRQIRFVNNAGQPPSKRRRINAACLTCRRRKTRCAGERPTCSTCVNNGHRCLGYSEETKGDGTGHDLDHDVKDFDVQEKEKEKELDIAHPQRQDRLRREVDDENRYGGDMSDGKSEVQSMDRPALAVLGSAEPSPRTASTEDMHSNRNRRGPGLMSPPTARMHHPPPFVPLSIATDDASHSSDPRRPADHRVPYFRYFGPTAIVPGYKQMVVSVRDRRRSGNASQSDASPLSHGSNPLRSEPGGDNEAIVEDPPLYDPNDPSPVHPFILTLCKTFFTHVGCNYPFLNERKFMLHIKEKRVESILVDAVCAIAARFSDAPLLTGGGDEKISRNERGQAYAQRAKSSTVDTFPCPSVGAVQALLLMAYEGFGANQDSALWMYLGLAIRMAIDLGLHKPIGIKYQGEKDPLYLRHRSHQGAESESPEDKRYEEGDLLTLQEQREVEQERKDTFWAVFYLDRVISSGTGRPVTFRDEEIELQYPTPHVDPKTGWPAPMPILLEIINLYGKVSDVMNRIKDMNDFTQEKWDKLAKMEHHLTKVYKRWDARLQFNVSNFRAYLNIGQGTTFILLHFWFHALFITLHQPTLMFPFGNLKDGVNLLSDSRELSMSSAKTICDILAFADLIDPKSFIGNPFTSQPMYIAACAFLMESSANASSSGSREGTPPDSATQVREQIKAASGVKYSRHSLLASAANQNYQQCYNSLQQLHNYWGGVKYILTALDQKAKGIWDPETYTTEEYEATKNPPQQMKPLFPNFAEARSSPKPAGPPIAWSLAGTANSPNSSLTLMYQNAGGSAAGAQVGALPRQPSTPLGNMIYDPIRQSQAPDATGIYPSVLPQGLPQSVERPRHRRLSDLSGHPARAHQNINRDNIFDDQSHIPVVNDGNTQMPQPQAPAQQTPGSQNSSGYERNFSTSPTTNTGDGGLGGVRPNNNVSSNFYYPSGIAYPMSWRSAMGGNMDALTFDSQDIDINALGLQQPDLMNGWLEYMPGDFMGMFDGQDMEQDQQQ